MEESGDKDLSTVQRDILVVFQILASENITVTDK